MKVERHANGHSRTVLTLERDKPYTGFLPAVRPCTSRVSGLSMQLPILSSTCPCLPEYKAAPGRSHELGPVARSRPGCQVSFPISATSVDPGERFPQSPLGSETPPMGAWLSHYPLEWNSEVRKTSLCLWDSWADGPRIAGLAGC